MTANVSEIKHPLIQHKLSILRDANTKPVVFRSVIKEISILLGYEATRDLALSMESINTPVAPMQAPTLKEKELVLVSILRAGNGMLDGMMELIPTAQVGFIGLFQHPEDLEIEEYYKKLPNQLSRKHVIVIDPM